MFLLSQLLDKEFSNLSHKASRVISEGDNLITKLRACNDDQAQMLKVNIQAVLRNLWSQYLNNIEVSIKFNKRNILATFKFCYLLSFSQSSYRSEKTKLRSHHATQSRVKRSR